MESLQRSLTTLRRKEGITVVLRRAADGRRDGRSRDEGMRCGGRGTGSDLQELR